MSTPNVDNVLGGPAKIQLADADVGHTQGGMTVTISPQTRPVIVDQYGSSEIQIRHTGDNVRVSAAFAEWSADTVKNTYHLGTDSTSGSAGAYLGIGATAGALYGTQDLKVIPFLTADAAKLIQMFAATPIGELAINFNNDDDRLFETEFACLLDEAQTDGEWHGKIFLN